MTCRLCRAETEDDRCEDRDACRRRVQRNARATVDAMKKIPLTKERQQQLYREAMGR